MGLLSQWERVYKESQLTVVVLRGSEDCRRRTGDVPSRLNTKVMEKSDKSMSHESDTSTLRSRAEEGNLGLLVPQDLCIVKHRLECGLANRGAIILIRIDDTDPSSRIGFDFIPEHTDQPVRRCLSVNDVPESDR